MKISSIGLGYVGLVTSACLAEWGHEVTGTDASPDRLDALANGRVPFFEPGLAELVKRNTAEGRLRFVASSREAAESAEIVFVAVGTHDGNGGWQTETVLSCLSDVVPHMRDDAVLVVRSTLPPDFIRQLPRLLRSLRQETGRPPLPVMLNPEFTREGVAIHDFMQAERVVLGAIDDPDGYGAQLLHQLYEQSGSPILVMPAIDAAFAKLGANLFLATKISFANELAGLCDAFGANIDRVVEAMAYDNRIGGRFLHAGVGFGGSCLPHQVTMTVRTAALADVPAPLLTAVDHINHRQRDDFVERMATMLGGSVAGTRIALLGLTFKPNTDDLRDAPSLVIAANLIAQGASVVAYDPMASARERSRQLVPGLETVANASYALFGADAVGLVTEWPEFIELDWASVKNLMRRPLVVDGRGALSAETLLAAGFQYSGFGRGSSVDIPSAEPVAIPIASGDEELLLSPSAVGISMTSGASAD